MAKQQVGRAKFQVPGGQATPAPPVGTSLGKYGINLGQFVQQFNERTKDMKGTTIPVEITIFTDQSFTFVTKTPPATDLLKQAAQRLLADYEPGEADPLLLQLEKVPESIDYAQTQDGLAIFVNRDFVRAIHDAHPERLSHARQCLPEAAPLCVASGHVTR